MSGFQSPVPQTEHDRDYITGTFTIFRDYITPELLPYPGIILPELLPLLI